MAVSVLNIFPEAEVLHCDRLGGVVLFLHVGTETAGGCIVT